MDRFSIGNIVFPITELDILAGSPKGMLGWKTRKNARKICSVGWHNLADTQFGKEINMERYANLDGDSSVVGYEIGNDFIKVQFSDGSIYVYTCASAGASNIEQMKKFARNGEGLNAFINKNVRKAYKR